MERRHPEPARLERHFTDSNGLLPAAAATGGEFDQRDFHRVARKPPAAISGHVSHVLTQPRYIQKASAHGGRIIAPLRRRAVNPLSAQPYLTGHHALSAAPYSVRVARPPRAGRDRGDEPLRILVGYDGSPDADRVVRTVAGRFWPQGTRVRLVTVVDEQILRAIPVTVTGTALAQERLGRVQQFLDDALRSLRDVGLEVSDKIEQGEPKRLLVEEAKTWQADSLFVGSRGLGRVARLLSGSVSTALADRAPCTVEVVRPRSAEAQGT